MGWPGPMYAVYEDGAGEVRGPVTGHSRRGVWILRETRVALIERHQQVSRCDNRRSNGGSWSWTA